jgi:hypothetical protein
VGICAIGAHSSGYYIFYRKLAELAGGKQKPGGSFTLRVSRKKKEESEKWKVER